MDFQLTPEQEKMVKENLGLVHWLLNRSKFCYEEREDLEQMGIIGLIKAVVTFDGSKSKFSTYATRIIQNEWLMGLRKNKHRIQELSLDEEVCISNSKGNDETATRMSFIPDSTTSNFTERTETVDLINNILSYVLNNFNTQRKIIFFYSRAGIHQDEIADIMGLSQSYVSRIISRINGFIYGNHNTFNGKKGVFKLELKSNTFQLRFLTSDVQRFNRIFANVLIDPINHDKLQHFKIECTKDQVEICLPAELESFALIASLIREIEIFSLTVGENVQSPRTENNLQKNQKVDTTRAADKAKPDKATINGAIANKTITQSSEVKAAPPAMATDASSTEAIPLKTIDVDVKNVNDVRDSSESSTDPKVSDNFAEAKTEKYRKRGRKRGEERESVKSFILSQEGSFTPNNVVKAIPDISYRTIMNEINSLVNSGTITKIEKGVYIVKK